MNKLFDFHPSPLYTDAYRPYYTGTWEPIAMPKYKMPNFQYKRVTGEYFKMAQVVSGTEYDITSYFYTGSELITTWTNPVSSFVFAKNGRNVSDYYGLSYDTGIATSNKFTLAIGETMQFYIDGTFTQSNPANYVKLHLYNNTSLIESKTMTSGKDGILYTSSVNSSDYTVRIEMNYGTGVSTRLSQTSVTCKKMNLDLHNNYITYSGLKLQGELHLGQSQFIAQPVTKQYSDMCEVKYTDGWLTSFTRNAGSITITDFDLVFGGGAVASTNYFTVVNGETVDFIYIGAITNLSFFLTDGINSVTMSSDTSNYWTKFTAVSTFSSDNARIIIQSSNNATIESAFIVKSHSSEQIELKISSTVDYADTYYKGGFIQNIYRLANVRRSSQPQITEIGDERNGVLVKEKIITSTKYTIRMKCNEAIMDALITGSAANMTVTDQTGKTFTMNNVSIDKADWNRSNGVVSITFDDNVNVFTLNTTDL